MTALRGADALECIVSQPRVVCIKFRPPSAPPIGVISPPSSPSSPISDESKTNVQDSPCPDLKRTTELDDSGKYPHEGEGEWVVLDMLDDHGALSHSPPSSSCNKPLSAFSSILRILHRHASHPISSSFVPSSSIITVSHNSFASYDTIPYPEWRINTVENARKAGMGDVGKAMAWMLWTEKGLGESLLGNIRHHRQAFSREMQYKPTIPPDIYCGSDDESDDDSEMEWDGWMRDLERQSRVKHHSDKVARSSRQAHIPASASLPSPPLSEASPTGSPRVRSPSLSVSQLGASSFIQYPNIGNIIQARGYRSTEHPHSPENIKNTTVSTVSVGMVPSPRRRSSTLLSELGATKRDHGKGKQDREPFPAIPANGIRVNARTVSVSVGLQSSPSASVRHARSSSNLRVSSSPYGSDAAESAGHPGPSSPSKRQSAFMRGMSLRAGKLVRGLESAIDFVDEKSV